MSLKQCPACGEMHDEDRTCSKPLAALTGAGLAAEVDAVLCYSLAAVTITPEAKALLEAVKAKALTPPAPAAGSEFLWSQAFIADDYHLIPRKDHDPRATGWISRCGRFCTGEPIPLDRVGDLACPKCLSLAANTKASEGAPTR